MLDEGSKEARIGFSDREIAVDDDLSCIHRWLR
jgi:hypothetical protein